MIDFYPFFLNVVLKCNGSVGTNVGDIGLWEVGSRERLVLRNFKVWDLGACSMPLQVCHLFPYQLKAPVMFMPYD